jgi:PTS system sucrose-specific IIC component
MGIGEPLIYGVTLPLGKPFIGACIGGAFGGAWQAYQGIGSYALGISGIPLAAATNNALLYLGGVLIAYAAGFAATWLIGFDDPPEETDQA